MPVLATNNSDLCIEKVKDEDVFDGEATSSDPLLEMIAQEGFYHLAVRLHTVNPPVVTEQFLILIDQLAEPRNHRAHVIKNRPF